MGWTMENGIRIVEKKKPTKGSTAIFAFPDVGLVGPIAVKHVVNELGMEEIGHITSNKFPPVTAVHKSRPAYPVRIFGKGDLIVLTSEIPIVPDLIGEFSSSLIEWLKEIQAKKALILGGLPHQNRMEVEEPEVHGIPSDGEMDDLLTENDIHVLQEGFITGINGVFLRELAEEGLPGIYLMAESHRSYPDPGSAASVLEVVSELEGLDINIKKLREEEEEIKVAARDLMRKTQNAMQKSGKDQEEEIPMMYG